ncbi:MAG: hypothetical protein R2879_18190 [Saprospiraceae bacterium]
MEPIIFEPLHSGLLTPVMLAVFTAIGLVLIWYILKKNKKERNNTYQKLWAMLAFFAVLIAGGFYAMNWFMGERVGEVVIKEEGIKTAYGDIPYEDIKDIVIYLDRKSSPFTGFQPGAETKRLLIIKNDNTSLSFSEGNYPINEMIGPMRKRAGLE